MTKVFVVGIAVLDFVFKVDEIPSQAVKYRAKDATIVGGGCAAGAAVAISRLGGEATLATRLGEDAIASLIVADLKADGVDLSCSHYSKGGKSSFSSIYVDKNGERQILNFRGSGLIETADWIEPPQDLDAIICDTRLAQATNVAMEIARKRDLPGIVDAEALLDGADMTKASHVAFAKAGLEEFSGEQSISRGLRVAATKLKGWLCVTDGADGTYMLHKGQVEHIPAFKVDAVDTLGAGDVWHGAFALRLAEGASELDAVQFANAAAALKCKTFGGRRGCPNRAATELFLMENG